MRIISGTARGRRLKSPEGNKIRPTSDRVKESIFNMLAFQLPGKKVLDLFAGTGNLGLEALSRGAVHATFVDVDREAQKLIMHNIKLLGFEERARVCHMDSFEAVRRMGLKKEKFDIIFIDPPYKEGLYEEIIETVIKGDIIENDGYMVIEHPSAVKLDEVYWSLQMIKNRKYGNTTVTIYKKEDGDENRSIPW